jgi:hypothetical protein
LRPKREIRRLERKYGVDYREIQEGNCRWHWWESSNSYRQDVRVRGLLAELQELKRANKIRVYATRRNTNE